MMHVAEHPFWLALLAIFSIVFTILAVVTASNAFRLRRILLQWHGGQEFAGVFLLAIVGIWGLSLYMGADVPLFNWFCYGWIAGTWYFSSVLMSMRFVTDHGIVKNLNDPDQTVPWYGIHDYSEQETEEGVRFVFLYRSPDLTRLEILVPNKRLEAFRSVLMRKFERRFTESRNTILDRYFNETS